MSSVLLTFLAINCIPKNTMELEKSLEYLGLNQKKPKFIWLSCNWEAAQFPKYPQKPTSKDRPLI